jgi:hypothetical protein
MVKTSQRVGVWQRKVRRSVHGEHNRTGVLCRPPDCRSSPQGIDRCLAQTGRSDEGWDGRKFQIPQDLGITAWHPSSDAHTAEMPPSTI